MSFDPTQYTKSQFLKGSDLEEPLVVTVAAAYEHTFEIDGSVKPALEFVDLDQHLILNKTNIKAMIAMFGTDVDEWIGKRIMLIPVPDAYQGKAGIRLQKVARAAKPAAKLVPVEEVEGAEEIPF